MHRPGVAFERSVSLVIMSVIMSILQGMDTWPKHEGRLSLHSAYLLYNSRKSCHLQLDMSSHCLSMIVLSGCLSVSGMFTERAPSFQLVVCILKYTDRTGALLY
ncbi:hypothetical protein BJ912DRAFT_648378 [Pholiota molesta]|nr:hypothetical protein BJ912DRAFT_648378 [Pholiota molesta]